LFRQFKLFEKSNRACQTFPVYRLVEHLAYRQDVLFWNIDGFIDERSNCWRCAMQP